ncbi:hypothetical protein ElyMa_000335600 [Elysia marginata]|uniref:Uncharacterized protein n=1 Tax=Elysia marginata TaxID=1093978 RepID=A0AAV4FEA8_9GAST|nr:hypothetical protein ElyMa_000335600 [Elysia marginata]
MYGHKESLIVDTVKGKKDKRHPRNNLPDVIDYPADFQQQAMELTRPLLLELDLLPVKQHLSWMERAASERSQGVRDNKSKQSSGAGPA